KNLSEFRAIRGQKWSSLLGSSLRLWWPATLHRSAASCSSTLRSACSASSATATPTQSWLRQPVEVKRTVPNRISFSIQELWRLLKDQRWRHAFGDGRIKDVQAVFMQINADEGA